MYYRTVQNRTELKDLIPICTSCLCNPELLYYENGDTTDLTYFPDQIPCLHKFTKENIHMKYNVGQFLSCITWLKALMLITIN